ncbi:MAG: DNA primase, partial [Chloroflexia bacterium]
MSAIEEIKARLDLVELVSEYVPLKTAGRNYKALCPFHQERTPSFIVFPDSQHFHCFGCGASGDIFGFVMRMENRTFPEALQLLAQRAGVALRPPTPQEEEEDREKQRLRELNLAAALFFHRELRLSDGAAGARAYLGKRGIRAETVESFLLGYAPDRWDALLGYLRERGYAPAEIVWAGLAVEREGGGTYDRFRNRLIFPIRDLRGHIIGFGGRALDEAQVPKYLNSPQTPLFDKGSALYGIDRAAPAIRRTGRAILVEGYFDVLMAHQSGYENVVAPMGTALTEHQVRLLRHMTHSIYLAMDADSAGAIATLRGMEVIREAMGEQSTPVPTAQGLVRLERVLDGEVRIVVLPPNQDPDEVIRADPGEWEKRLAEALPVLEYLLQRLAQEADLSTARGKAEAVEQVLPLLAEIPDPIEQGHYVQRLAHLVQVDDRAILARLRQRRAPGRRSAAAPETEVPTLGRTEQVECYLIALVHRFPHLAQDLPPDVPSLLSREEHRALWEMRPGGEASDQEMAEPLRVYLEELFERFRVELDEERAPEAL